MSSDSQISKDELSIFILVHPASNKTIYYANCIGYIAKKVIENVANTSIQGLCSREKRG